MCGIAGVVSSSQPVDEALLRRMRDKLLSRGPDAAGLWISRDRRVAVAHRRLVVVDPSAAAGQPMCSPDGAICVTFNGEIYNFTDLRKELSADGTEWRTKSDTEVLLVGYRQWGEKVIDRLEGMFAFALYDSRKELLFLARDLAGQKPLYYAAEQSRLSFASEVKALLVDPGVSRDVDVASLQHYLAYGYVSPGRSMLSSIKQVEPGTYLVHDVRSGRFRRKKYWVLPDASRGSGNKTDGDYVCELEELLSRSVSQQLQADVPVGVLLSGGLDSSLVTALAARAHGRIRTFHARFSGAGRTDESKHALRVSREFGTDHTEVDIEEPTPASLERLADYLDEPIGDSSILPTSLLSHAVRSEVTVALGGDGGDELFGGYPYYSRLLRRDLISRFLPPLLRRRAARIASTVMPVGLRGRRLLLEALNDADDVIASAPLYCDRRTREGLLGTDACLAVEETPEERRRFLAGSVGSAARRAMQADFLGGLPGQYLVKVDRASMMFSLEMRSPFLSRPLVEFAFARLPDHLRATRKARKVILRQLAATLLPPDFNVTRKQGFGSPVAQWYQGMLGRYIDDVLLGSPASFFRKSAIEQVLRAQRAGRSMTRIIFALLMFELWRQRIKPSQLTSSCT